MAKRGLPDTFKLDVPAPTDEPAQWGDYLDETLAPKPESKVVHLPPPPAAREVPRLPIEDPEVEDIRPIAAEPPPVPARQAQETRRPRPSRPVPEPPPDMAIAGRVRERFQLNVTPETRRVAEGLLNHVVTVGMEKTTTHADIFEALVNAAYEARELLDLRAVRHRGRWGTPTASAFRVALKTALAQAIAEHMKQQDGRW